MAKINAGAQSTWRKKAGAYVYRKWRNLNVAAIYQPNVKNPRTLAQQRTRARLGALSQLSNGMAGAINNGLRNVTKGTKWSPRNMFVKLNFEVVSATTPESVSIDYTHIVVSKGPLNNPNIGAPQFDNPNEVTLSCALTGLPGGYQSYEVFTVLYSADLTLSVMKATRFESASGTITVEVPSSWNGARVHIWCWAKYIGNTDVGNALYEGTVSNSIYCGSGNIS